MSTPAVSRSARWFRQARHALAHSLRARLVALFMLLALGMAATFVFGMQYALSVGWRDAARPLVVNYVDHLVAEIGSPPSVERAQALVARLPLGVCITGPVVNWRSHPDVLKDTPRRWNEFSRWRSTEARLFDRTTADGHLIQLRVNVRAWNDRPRFIGWVTLTGLLLLTALAYVRVRRMLRPLDDIRDGAQRFGRGDFAQPIPVRHPHRPDELGELAGTINTMGADIHQMLDAKRALLLAISHELRSPLTRARLNTELLPETPELQPHREALLRDLALMRDLVSDLLESERLASSHVALNREPTDLAALVDEVLAGLNGAPQVQIQVQAHVQPGLPLLNVDRTRLRLLLRNLLDNALRYSADAAQPPEIHVRRQDDGAVRITVRDYGPGVPPEQIPRLAEPFYRPDAARTREGGGVGLGLYLCKLVALAHGGSCVVRNAQPGLEASVVLPKSAGE